MSYVKNDVWLGRSFESNRSTLGVSMPMSLTPWPCKPSTSSGAQGGEIGVEVLGIGKSAGRDQHTLGPERTRRAFQR